MLRLLVAVLLLFSVIGRVFGQTESNQVWVGFALHELSIDPQGWEDGFFIRGRLDFWWDPNGIESFNPRSTEIFNGLHDVKLRPVATSHRSTNPSNIPPNLKHEALLISGTFKAYNDFSDFPFDEHEIGIILFNPDFNENEIHFMTEESALRPQILFPALTNGWRINSVALFTQNEGFRHSVPTTTESEEAAFSAIVIQISRNVAADLVRIIFPMILIWGLSYIGHFWNDSSPASRFSGSAMIAAVALSLGVRPLIPGTNYLMAIHAAFLGLYTCIAVDAVTTALAFHAKAQKDDLRERIYRRIGKLASPVLVGIVVLIFFWLASGSVRDALFDSSPEAQVSLN